MIRTFADNRRLRKWRDRFARTILLLFAAIVVIDVYGKLRNEMHSIAVDVATNTVDNHEWWEHEEDR